MFLLLFQANVFYVSAVFQMQSINLYFHCAFVAIGPCFWLLLSNSMTLSCAFIDDEEAQAHEFTKLQSEENWKAGMIWGQNQTLKRKTSAWDQSVEESKFTNGLTKPRLIRKVATPQQTETIVPQLPLAEPSSGSVQPVPLENISLRKYRCRQNEATIMVSPRSLAEGACLQFVMG